MNDLDAARGPAVAAGGKMPATRKWLDSLIHEVEMLENISSDLDILLDDILMPHSPEVAPNKEQESLPSMPSNIRECVARLRNVYGTLQEIKNRSTI